jgi:hypothetical protein
VISELSESLTKAYAVKIVSLSPERPVYEKNMAETKTNSSLREVSSFDKKSNKEEDSNNNNF